eukprot:4297031-Prymnesium_polylepis.1
MQESEIVQGRSCGIIQDLSKSGPGSCVSNVTFGCSSDGKAMWVDHGCAGLFACGQHAVSHGEETDRRLRCPATDAHSASSQRVTCSCATNFFRVPCRSRSHFRRTVSNSSKLLKLALVIVRYKEPGRLLHWIADTNATRIILVNKGADDLGKLPSVQGRLTVVSVPNVGREGFSFLDAVVHISGQANDIDRF